MTKKWQKVFSVKIFLAKTLPVIAFSIKAFLVKTLLVKIFLVIKA